MCEQLSELLLASGNIHTYVNGIYVRLIVVSPAMPHTDTHAHLMRINISEQRCNGIVNVNLKHRALIMQWTKQHGGKVSSSSREKY